MFRSLYCFAFIAGLIGIQSLADAASSKSMEELARLFARYPEGSGFQLSPNGDRILAGMPQNGSAGAVVFDVSDPSKGLVTGTLIAPDTKYSVGRPRWVDNDNVAYILGMHNTNAMGYHIDRITPGKRSNSRFADTPWSGHYERGKFRFLVDGLPSHEGMFLSSQAVDLAGVRYKSDMVLLELTKHQNAKEIKRWLNPGNIDDFVFRGTELVAIAIDEDYFTMDFSLLSEGARLTPSSLEKVIKPLDMGGDIFAVGQDLALIYTEEDEGDKSGVAVYSFDKEKIVSKPIFTEGYSIEPESATVMTYRAGDEIAGIRYHTEKPVCHYFDPGIGGIMGQLESMLKGDVPVFEGLSPDNRFLYYEVRSDTKDSSFMRLDLQAGSSELLYAVRPWIHELNLTPMQPVSFKNRDGITVHGYLILPKGYKKGKPVGMVVNSHGGPWVRDNWGFDAESQYFASLGYAVLKINYRGSVGYGEKFGLEGDLLDISEASPLDVIDGAKWAIEEGYAHKDKVAFSGGSYGAFISLSVAGLAPDLVACAIGLAGAYDLTLLKEADEFDEMPWVERLYGDYEGNEERYEELSPTARAVNVKSPILLIHGGKDARVGYRQANAMYDALKEHGADVELIKRRFMVHGFPNEEMAFEYYVVVGKFLRKHLGK
jgi:fermentation-respiration switch protein FrsA (DUF1100 family)